MAREHAQRVREEEARLRATALGMKELAFRRHFFRMSHVSHELCTPLTAIYFASNLRDGLLGNLTCEQHEHLAQSLTKISQLKDMVDELLDITRIDTHKFTLDSQRVNPLMLIADVLGTWNKFRVIYSIESCPNSCRARAER